MILAQNWLKTAKSSWHCPFNYEISQPQNVFNETTTGQYSNLILLMDGYTLVDTECVEYSVIWLEE